MIRPMPSMTGAAPVDSNNLAPFRYHGCCGPGTFVIVQLQSRNVR